MMMVLPPSVNHVALNVKLVSKPQKTVPNVKKTEDQSLTVHVHSNKVIMKLTDKLTVHNVTQDVPPVQSMDLVKPVKLTPTESPHQNVHVSTDSTKTPSNVSHVPHNVQPVLIMPTPVSPVPVTESDQKMDVLA